MFILQCDILHNEYFYFWYSNDILKLILLRSQLSNNLNAGFLLVFLQCCIAAFT